MPQPPDDLLNIFWVEAAEYLETLNRMLMQLEVAPPEKDHAADVREVSRIAHSLKGAARAVGQSTIETLAHQMEELFDGVLAGALTLTPSVCDVLYDSLDIIQMIADGSPVTPEIIAQALQQMEAVAGSTDVTDAKRQTLQIELPPLPAEDMPGGGPPTGGDTVRVSLAKIDRLMGQAGELLIARMHSEQRRRELQALLQEHRRWQRAWRQARSAYIRTTRRLRDRGEAGDGTADQMELLEFLNTTQHYLTLSGRALRSLNRALAQDTLHLTTLVDGLQADIASVRMLPFQTILGTFQRMVRDLARESGKEATLIVEGADVEMDKHVLEAIKTPLIHLLRNAVDHGIEPPEERMAAGKAASGTITLSVTTRGSDIQVSVADDGRGLNVDLIRQRAIEAGVITETEAGAMTPDEVASLIFVPGFSTAARVTAISGRGVGLDAVRQQVDLLRGRLWLENRPGQGAAFHLVVPVSLTRIRCLLVRVGEEQYAIPLTAVTRMITIAPDAVFYVEDRPMIDVMGRPLPLVALADVLERPGLTHDLTAETPVLVLHSTERAVAFIVDELLSEQELVLKKPGEELSRVRNMAGAAILGSGEVVIVLNAGDLIKNARRVHHHLEAASDAGDETEDEHERWVLVVDDSLTTRTLEKNILEAAGYRVRTATDGQEALQVLMEQSCDVIVADVEMPNMNGFELARRIKSDSRWQRLPVILVTSLDSPGDRERGLHAGADAYLVKTRFDQDELLQVIEQMI